MRARSSVLRSDRPVAQEGVINRWQRGVPVYDAKVVTPWFLNIVLVPGDAP